MSYQLTTPSRATASPYSVDALPSNALGSYDPPILPSHAPTKWSVSPPHIHSIDDYPPLIPKKRPSIGKPLPIPVVPPTLYATMILRAGLANRETAHHHRQQVSRQGGMHEVSRIHAD